MTVSESLFQFSVSESKQRISSALYHHVEGFLSRLFKQDPTRLIKLSTLTGLIFTQLRLAHISMLGTAGTPPRRTSGLIWHATFHPAAVSLSSLHHAHVVFPLTCWKQQQLWQMWVLRGAVGHGWFHAGGSNSSPGRYRHLPDSRVERVCSKSLTTLLISFQDEVKDLPEGVRGETAAEIKKSSLIYFTFDWHWAKYQRSRRLGNKPAVYSPTQTEKINDQPTC